MAIPPARAPSALAASALVACLGPLRLGLGVAILLAAAAKAAAAVSPSFDCARATTQAEVLICADPALARLDAQLGLVYREVRGQTDTAGQKALRTDQRNWLRVRDRECGTGTRQGVPVGERAGKTLCLKRMVEARLRWLSGDGPDEAPPRESTALPPLEGAWRVRAYHWGRVSAFTTEEAAAVVGEVQRFRGSRSEGALFACAGGLAQEREPIGYLELVWRDEIFDTVDPAAPVTVHRLRCGAQVSEFVVGGDGTLYHSTGGVLFELDRHRPEAVAQKTAAQKTAAQKTAAEKTDKEEAGAGETSVQRSASGTPGAAPRSGPSEPTSVGAETIASELDPKPEDGPRLSAIKRRCRGLDTPPPEQRRCALGDIEAAAEIDRRSRAAAGGVYRSAVTVCLKSLGERYAEARDCANRQLQAKR